jgi:hypothetical protein
MGVSDVGEYSVHSLASRDGEGASGEMDDTGASERFRQAFIVAVRFEPDASFARMLAVASSQGDRRDESGPVVFCDLDEDLTGLVVSKAYGPALAMVGWADR